MPLALFDLDRTLIDVNSATLWVRHEWKAGRLSTRDALLGGWWVLKYNLGYADGVDDIYRRAVQQIAGQREDELAARTQEWFDSAVVNHIRPGAVAAIDAHRTTGDRLVIATSSSPYAARAAQAAWGFDGIIHTRFEVRDGVFTGDIAESAYGPAKLDAVARWTEREGESLEAATFYTDSVTDLALLEAVANPVAVNPDGPLKREARKRGWPIVDWGRSAR